MTEQMRLLVTGSRGWTDLRLIATGLGRACDWFCSQHPDNTTVPRGQWVTLVHGAAKGADLQCKAFADAAGWRTQAFPAQWLNPDGTRNPTAGFERNEAMVRSGVDVCVAFAGACSKWAHRNEEPHVSHGTRHCAEYAASMGVQVFTVYPNGHIRDGSPA